MSHSTTPQNAEAASAHDVLEYWLTRLPRKPQTFGRRRAHAPHASRSLVRLPVRFGFDALWIHWPPGSRSPLHEHGSSGSVVGVLHGTLRELVHAPGKGVRARRNWMEGIVIDVPEGECHEVRNISNATAATVHVYQSHLSSMTFYEREGSGVLHPIDTHVPPRD